MIEIIRDIKNNTYNAHYTGVDAELIRDLFGTDTLPTAFTAHCEPYAVLKEIQFRNPDKTVVLI